MLTGASAPAAQEPETLEQIASLERDAGRLDAARATLEQALTAWPEAKQLRSLLALHKGNVAAVGREFGKERMQVHRWLKRYGIDVTQYR